MWGPTSLSSAPQPTVTIIRCNIQFGPPRSRCASRARQRQGKVTSQCNGNMAQIAHPKSDTPREKWQMAVMGTRRTIQPSAGPPASQADKSLLGAASVAYSSCTISDVTKMKCDLVSCFTT